MIKELNLYLLTYHPNPMATTSGRAYTGKKDRYILERDIG
jgi:hypothetical protein